MDGIDELILEKRSYSVASYHHVHSFGQLVIPINGRMNITIETHGFNETVEKIIFIPPDTGHTFHSFTGNRFLVIDIPQKFLSDNKRYGICFSLDERWKAIRMLLHNEVEEGEAGTGKGLTELFHYILRFLEKPEHSASLAYLRENYYQTVTVRRLAELEHYNTSYYCEWFRKREGLSPMAYLRRLRFEKARELLEQTDFSVFDIACRVGYEQQSTLTRLFIAELGMSPMAYRDKVRNPAKKIPNPGQNRPDVF